MDRRSLRHVVVLGVIPQHPGAIEQRARVRLFDRDRGGVRLTSVGRFLAERAASLLREADDFEQSPTAI